MSSMQSIPIPLGSEDTLPVLRARSSGVSRGTLLDIDVAGRTDRGRERARNDDAFVVAELRRSLAVRCASPVPAEVPAQTGGPYGLLMAVADGMGGHGGGDIASAVAIDALLQYVTWLMPWVRDGGRERQVIVDELADVAEICQRRLQNVARRKRIEQHEPGTTLTAVLITWPSAYVVHAGDSRCYWLRDGELTQVTTDHTLAAQLADYANLRPEDTKASIWSHVLNNAIGGGQRRVFADVHRLELRRGDVLLVCSDGVTRHVADHEIPALLRTATSSADDACRDLIATANRRGGRDNITAVVARV